MSRTWTPRAPITVLKARSSLMMRAGFQLEYHFTVVLTSEEEALVPLA